MGRNPCCDKSKVKRGAWSPEEDEILRNYIHKHGGTVSNWITLPQKAGLDRCGKSCRLRWLNYLRPDIKHGSFTRDEEKIICDLYNKIGSRWAFIASHLPGRTDNDVKNYWNTKLKKKLMMFTTHCRDNNTKPLIPMSDASASVDIGVANNFLASTNSLTWLPDLYPPSILLPENNSDLLLEADDGILHEEPVDYTTPISTNLDSSSNSCTSVTTNTISSFESRQENKCHVLSLSSGIDELYGYGETPLISGSEYSFDDAIGVIWPPQDEAIEAETNEDLFSIFYVGSKLSGVYQGGDN